MERVFLRIDKQMIIESLFALRAKIDPVNHEAVDEWDKLLRMIQAAPTTEDQSSGLPKISARRGR